MADSERRGWGSTARFSKKNKPVVSFRYANRYTNRMNKKAKDHRPMCRLCEHAHFGHEPHVFAESPVEKPVKKKVVKKEKRVASSTARTSGCGPEDGSSILPPPSICEHCGATAQMFEDALKWAAIREKQRARMKAKRAEARK